MNCRKLIKILLFGTVISSTYGDPCEEINAYASSNSIELDCSSNGELKVEVNNFLKEEAKEDFIQKFLKQFPDIEILNISYRKLTCELIIPENSKLRELHAAGNELSGKLNIPENSKLEYIDVSNNYSLSGELNIPNNSTLRKLYTGYNNLTGSIIIPENSKLEELEVYCNQFSGQLIIPKNCNLKELHVGNNNLTGNITIPESLINFYAQENQLTGDIIIPENSKLEILHVPKNKFNGKLIIPESCNIEDIDISDNKMKGEIILTEYSSIKELNARGNDINVLCDANTYETDTNYCKLKIQEQSQKNYLLITYVSSILIITIIIIILIILDNKKKRKLSEKNESNNDLLNNINVQESSFKVGKCYTAGSNYVPSKEDEITISANDRISIIEVLDNGRANGKNLNTQQSGIFPLSCLKNEVIGVQNKKNGTYKSAIVYLSISLSKKLLIQSKIYFDYY
ncbi:RNI-like protein [Neocallimastix californiae]|uniref:RNI-like protein n=1 Tax=Neocallimastix californiae TaxID=1754190 RepID=A0A1Y2EJ80_9FUNG|nr:RNI-like protein [Neocallimastix californiae]|eukprot:ORY70865.1 RNI-like protein [Neocallimastix californiae]